VTDDALRVFSVVAEPAGWTQRVPQLAATLRQHLRWVEQQQAEWLLAHPNADPRARGMSVRHWLLEPQLEEVRSGLEASGFAVWERPQPVARPEGMGEEDFARLQAARRRWRARVLRPWAGGRRGGLGHQVDAYRRSDGVALHIDWLSGRWPDRGRQAASLCQTDVRKLVLLRRSGESYDSVERTLSALFAERGAVADMQAKLPLRNVVLARL
jgi:hypothetical protein